MSKKTIITTVGTSLFTNFLSKEFQEFLIEELNEDKWSDTLITDIERSYFRPTEDDKKELNKLDKIIYGVKKTKIDNQIIYELTNTQEINIDASAEIKSILKIANNELADVYLLATDTFMSEFAADKIRDVFNNKPELKITVKEVKRIKDLSIDNVAKFEETGFKKIIDEIDAIATDENGKIKEDVILNISGGYKALIPFLTIYAQLKGLPLAYIYEESEEVIWLKDKILDIDFSSIDILYPYMEEEFYNKANKTNDEIKIFEELKRRHFIFEIKENNKVFIKETALGSMLKYAYDRYGEFSKKPFSFLVEFKLWEYFNKNKLENRKYEVRHECEIRHREVNDNKPEKPDLCFYENKQLKILGEIKSFGEVKRDDFRNSKKNKILKSAVRRITICQKKNFNLNKYILFIYKAPYHDVNLLKDYLIALKQELKNQTNFNNFDVYYFDIKTYDNEYKYNFQGFLQGSIKTQEFELKIN